MRPWLSRSLDFRCPGRVIPPGFRNTAEIAGLRRRPPEDIPVCDPVRRLVPMGNPVTAGADDAVERTTSGGQRGPGRRGDDGVNQSVDRRIGDAGEVV